MFLKKKKKIICNHDWKHARDDFIPEYLGAGQMTTHRGCWIVCVNCEQEELVYKEEWQGIMRKQEIDRN